MTDHTRERLRMMLLADEGLRLHAYQDSLGYWTIGVGRLIDRRAGGGISNTEALYLLENDINACVRDLVAAFPWFVDLDPVRQVVLVNMRFNLGLTKLRGFKNTLAAIAEGRYATAAHGMRQSLWAKQVKGRATRLAHMMETGEWPNDAHA